MYRGIKFLLSKSNKNPSNLENDFEAKDKRKSSKKSSFPSIETDEAETRKQMEKISKMVDKISTSDKLNEREKIQLARTLRTMQPAQDQANSAQKIGERFTPKLDMSQSKPSTTGFNDQTVLSQNSNTHYYNTLPTSSNVNSGFSHIFNTPGPFMTMDTALMQLQPPFMTTISEHSEQNHSRDSSVLVASDVMHSNSLFSSFSNEQVQTQAQAQTLAQAQAQSLAQTQGQLNATLNDFQFVNFQGFHAMSYRDSDPHNFSDSASEAYSNTSQLGHLKVFANSSPHLSEQSFSGLSASSMSRIDNHPEISHTRNGSLSTTGGPNDNNTDSISNFAAPPKEQPQRLLNSYPGAENPKGITFAGHENSMIPRLLASEQFAADERLLKSQKLRLEVYGIPKDNAKSRVETQIKIQLKLFDQNDSPVRLWTHILLPEILVSRDKFRHRVNKLASQQMTPPESEQHVLRLEAKVICSTNISHDVKVCVNCIRREYKRSLRRKNHNNTKKIVSNNQPSDNNLEQVANDSDANVDAREQPQLTGLMENDWGKQKLDSESRRIIIFNTNDLLCFSKGEVVLPTRITCYCRHHNEKNGYSVIFSVHDCTGELIAQTVTSPIMITDDHKSNKYKPNRTSFISADYDKEGIKNSGKRDLPANDGKQRLNNLVSMSPSLMALSSGALSFTEDDISANNKSGYAESRYLVKPGLAKEIGSVASSYNSNQESILASVYNSAPFAFGRLMGRSTSSGYQTDSVFVIDSSRSNTKGLSVPLSSSFNPSTQNNSDMFTDFGFSSNTILNTVPGNGPVTGGEIVKIFGSGFVPGSTVYFDNSMATSTTIHSGLYIECVSPPVTKPGPVPIFVVPPGYQVNEYQTKQNMRNAMHNFIPTYNYVERTDTELLELILHILSLRGRATNSNNQLFLNNQLAQSSAFSLEPSSDYVWDKITQPLDPSFNLSRIDSSSSNGQMLNLQISQLRQVFSNRDLVLVEVNLIKILSMMVGLGELDTPRLAFKHPSTHRNLLHFGSLLGMIKLTHVLITCKVPVDSIDRSGYTPFHFSCVFDRYEISKFLLESGANSSLVSHSGLDGLQLAVSHGYPDIFQLILEFKERNGIPTITGSMVGNKYATNSSPFSNAPLSQMDVDIGMDIAIKDNKNAPNINIANQNSTWDYNPGDINYAQFYDASTASPLENQLQFGSSFHTGSFSNTEDAQKSSTFQNLNTFNDQNNSQNFLNTNKNNQKMMIDNAINELLSFNTSENKQKTSEPGIDILNSNIYTTQFSTTDFSNPENLQPPKSSNNPQHQ